MTTPHPETGISTWKDRLKAGLCRALRWGERMPWGVRSLLGLLFMAGGVLGFLPILGFWMIPLGVALICLDIPPLRRWLTAKLGQDDA